MVSLSAVCRDMKNLDDKNEKKDGVIIAGLSPRVGAQKTISMTFLNWDHILFGYEIEKENIYHRNGANLFNLFQPLAILATPLKKLNCPNAN